MKIPVVEYLTAHDVSANTPAVFISFLAKPVVTQKLSVEVMGLV